MRLYFPAPGGPAEGTLLRSFLRQCAVSTELARAVKFHGGGFFADGAPILANMRVRPGQVVSFDLPPEGGGVLPQPEIPVCIAYEDFFALVLEKPAGLAVLSRRDAGQRVCGPAAGAGGKPGLPPGEPD